MEIKNNLKEIVMTDDPVAMGIKVVNLATELRELDLDWVPESCEGEAWGPRHFVKAVIQKILGDT